MTKLEQATHDFAREDFVHTFGQPRINIADDAEWQKLRDAGTTLWLDTGDVDAATKLWNSSFSALTTNNTLLNKEIQKGLYDDLVGRAAETVRGAEPDIDERTLVLEIAFILNAHHALRLVEQFDALVSVELHTDLAHDIERSVAYGLRYYHICPERFIVKVPLTPAGYLAARKLRMAGVPINFTLGFSARQNLVASVLTQPRYVNVFMGRLNAFVSSNDLGDGRNVGERATLATQREVLAQRQAGRSESRLIGASIRNGEQIGYLAGIDVQTMPTGAAAEYREHPLDQVVTHLGDSPEIALGPEIELEDFNGNTLWDITDTFRAAVESLLQKDLDALDANGLRQHFVDAQVEDFLPQWTPEELETVTRDGKIPVYETWKDRLRGATLGLDALMNISALCSFATDQKALDDRVSGLLGKVAASG